VDAIAKRAFIHAERLEPAEQPPPRGVRERPLVFDFVRTGRLADEHHLRAGHRARHRIADDVRTQPARVQRREMLRESVGHDALQYIPTMKRFLLLILVPLTANAWTRTSDQQIGYRAAQLAPYDLRLVIIRYSAQYYAGIDRALAEEGTDIHRAHLRERIEHETAGIIMLLRNRQPMQQVVFRLGM